MPAPHPSFQRLLACARAASAHRAPENRIKTVKDLQVALGWTPQRTTNMKSRGVSKEGAIQAERMFSCPPSFVLDGMNAPDWMNAQHVLAGEAPAHYPVAHVLSQSPFEAVPLLAREQLLQHDHLELFRFATPDDAMAPELPAGIEIVWTTRRRIAPGRLLLLADSHGQLHVRRCAQGESPGSWVGAALNQAYRSFKSDDAGLRVIAVYKGRLEPDDA